MAKSTKGRKSERCATRRSGTRNCQPERKRAYQTQRQISRHGDDDRGRNRRVSETVQQAISDMVQAELHCHRGPDPRGTAGRRARCATASPIPRSSTPTSTCWSTALSPRPRTSARPGSICSRSSRARLASHRARPGWRWRSNAHRRRGRARSRKPGPPAAPRPSAALHPPIRRSRAYRRRSSSRACG